MSGYENHNYAAFHAAANKLREAAYDVLCPAENFGGNTNLSYDTYMRQDLVLVSICDIIAMLPGWEKSRGALCELHAALTIGMPAINAESLENLDISLGKLGFIMWRKELADQYRDQRKDEVGQDYAGILATAGATEFLHHQLRSPDPQSLSGVGYSERVSS
jgi:hypothetical protein